MKRRRMSMNEPLIIPLDNGEYQLRTIIDPDSAYCILELVLQLQYYYPDLDFPDLVIAGMEELLAQNRR